MKTKTAKNPRKTHKTEPKRKEPKLGHRADGRYFLRIRGRVHYLGRSESEAIQRRHALLAELTATGLSTPVACQPRDILVSEALALYLEYAKGYYGDAISRIRAVALIACDLYGSEPAAAFGPLKLRAVQSEAIKRGYGRRNLNQMIGRLRAAFKWMGSHELIPAPVAVALTLVPGLRAGKTDAKESEPVRPVSEEHIEVVRAILPPTVRAMVDVQLATGARPGEIVGLRPCDIDRSGPVWLAVLTEHKTAHHGKVRTLYLGPKAQSALRPFLLNRGPEDFIFDPREAQAQRFANCLHHRRPSQSPKPRKTERVMGDHYDVDGYRRAITRACLKAGITAWHPHQLRHNCATNVRKQYGIEGAQLVLGHSSADITQVYAEVDREKALAIAAKIG